MKRYFALFLALLLLLSGCASEVKTPASEEIERESTSTTGEEIKAENLCVAMEEACIKEGLNDWINFYFASTHSKKTEITINSTYDGVTYVSVLSYDGEKYTLTEDGQTRSYQHLIYSSQNLPKQSDYDFAEYYLLSDDPEMTAERYFGYMASSSWLPGFSPTTVVLSDYLTFDRAENFGAVPEKFAFKENLSLFQNASFGKDGFYQTQVVSLSSPHSSEVPETVRKCYTYDFKAMANDALPAEEWDCKGYRKGQRVLYEDDLFSPKAADRLPDTEDVLRGLYNTGVFDYEEGYILVRTNRLAPWNHSSPVISYISCYCELIVTAYDADGRPVWQTTSDIFIG